MFVTLANSCFVLMGAIGAFVMGFRSCGGEEAKHSSKSEEETVEELMIPALNLNDGRGAFSFAINETVFVE